MKLINYATLLTIFACFNSYSSVVGQSEKQTELRSYRGYFWGEKLPQKEDKKEEKYKRPIVPPAAEMMKMHPEELRKLKDETLAYAVYTQDPEDNKAYWRVLDVIRRKADSFVNVSGFVKMKNPDLLSSNLDYPTNNPGRKVKLQDDDKELVALLGSKRDEYALLMFSQVGCSACEVQRNILENLTRETHWIVKDIDINQNPLAQAKFNVVGTPLTVLISRKDMNNWLPVAVGTDSLSNVKSNIYRSIRLIEKDTTPQQWYMMERERGSFFDPNYYDSKGQQK